MDGRADLRDPRSRQAQARGEVRERPQRVRVHDLGAAGRAGGRGQPVVLRLEWERPDARAWLASAPVRPVQVLLEVGEVVARSRVHGTQPTWILGAAWVSRRSRPMEGDPVLVATAV